MQVGERVVTHGARPDPELALADERESTYDELQDIVDEVAWVREPLQGVLMLVELGGEGDAPKVAVYMRDVGYVGRSVELVDSAMLALRYESGEARASDRERLLQDPVMMRMVQRVFISDVVVPHSPDWGVLAAAGLKLLELPSAGRHYRISARPAKLAQEFVGQLDDECARVGAPLVPFSPKVFTHSVMLVQLAVDAATPLMAAAIVEADSLYLKPWDKSDAITEDKLCRAYYKLYEAHRRFALPPMAVGQRAVDLGASPGGWTQYLVEQGVQCVSIDPGKLALDASVAHMYTHLCGNCKAPEVIEAARSRGPFDWLCCDMNILSDELGPAVAPYVDLLRVGGYAIITIKMTYCKPRSQLRRGYARGARRFLASLEKHTTKAKLVGIKWLLANRNERTAVFVRVE